MCLCVSSFFFVQRVRHGCIGKQVLWWYLRHFAATWDGRWRQGGGGRAGAGREGCPGWGLLWPVWKRSSVHHPTLLHQEFNGGWRFAINGVSEGRCERWGTTCFRSLCKASSQAAARASVWRLKHPKDVIFCGIKMQCLKVSHNTKVC